MKLNEKLQVEDGTESANKQMYISLVGGTGRNIAFSVGVILRFMHFPSKHHSRAAKRILRYVVGMVDYGIWFKYMSYSELIGYTNSDWGGYIKDKRSTSGYLFSLRSDAISWRSNKQATIALSA